MIELYSKRWAELSAKPARNLIAMLYLLFEEADSSDDLDENKWQESLSDVWIELHEQIAHQNTLWPAAYGCVPHLVKMAMEYEFICSSWFLSRFARIAAPMAIVSPLPADLKPDYEAALNEVARVSLIEAHTPGHEKIDEYWSILCTATALNKRGVLVRIVEVLPEFWLQCSTCQVHLWATMTSNGLKFCTGLFEEGPKLQPAITTPREPPDAVWSPDQQPDDDFEWLFSLCHRAEQTEAQSWVCHLYGKSSCPKCGVHFIVNKEIEREAYEVVYPYSN